MKHKRTFLSDNASGIHPEVLNKIAAVNPGHACAYGHDEVSETLQSVFKEHFGQDARAVLALTGTGANVIALQSVVRSHDAIIVADCAHLHRDECGAPEKFIGCKLLVAATKNGKLTPDTVQPLLRDTNMVHRSQPKVLSITQATEWGTLYTSDEISALSSLCTQHGLLLHMDGARICNAAVAHSSTLKEATFDLGVDILSFGGTKNGLLAAEAVVFRNAALATPAEFCRKQAMQLGSKMRFIAAQLLALLEGDLWKSNASHANAMASYMAEGLSEYLQPLVPVETNALFLQLPEGLCAQLQQEHQFSIWDSEASIVRIMTSFDTERTEVEAFITAVKNTLPTYR